MQDTPLPQHPNPSTPLHEILVSWGRRVWNGPAQTPKPVVSLVRDDGSLQQQLQHAAARQLATALRMNGLEGEDSVMLSALENQLQTKEMTFEAYAARIQNLFPRHFARLDVTLRMKVAALALPGDH